MATTKNINELDTISPTSAKILAMSPTGKVGYISDIFNEQGKLKEVADFNTYIAESKQTTQNIESAITALVEAKNILSVSIAEQNTQLDNIDTEHNTKIEELNNAITQLNQFNTTITEIVNTNKEKLANLSISDIIGLTTALNSKLSDDAAREIIEGYGYALQSSLQSVSEKSDHTAEELQQIKQSYISNEFIADYNGEDSSLIDILNSLHSKVSRIESQLASAGNAIDASVIDTRINEIQNKVTNLEKRIDALAGEEEL